MKMILITYYEAVDEDVMQVLKRAGADAYTQWTGTKGRGRSSGPHLGSHVWPKKNNAVAVCVDDAVARDIMDGIRGLRERMRHEGVKAFVWPVEEIT